MIVFKENVMYSLDMTPRFFKDLKESNPDHGVGLELICDSNYKYVTNIRIGDLESWTPFNNLATVK